MVTLRGSVDANTQAITTLDALQRYSERVDASQEAMARLVISGDIAFADKFAESIKPIADAQAAVMAAIDDPDMRGKIEEAAKPLSRSGRRRSQNGS